MPGWFCQSSRPGVVAVTWRAIAVNCRMIFDHAALNVLKTQGFARRSERFNARAAALGVSVSQMIRDTALHGAVYVTLDRAQAGYEFRRLGAMLKHLYPARDSRWTAEDRKKWWALIHELRERADTLEATASGGKDRAVGRVSCWLRSSC
jgi:hypothetical protein